MPQLIKARTGDKEYLLCPTWLQQRLEDEGIHPCQACWKVFFHLEQRCSSFSCTHVLGTTQKAHISSLHNYPSTDGCSAHLKHSAFPAPDRGISCPQKAFQSIRRGNRNPVDRDEVASQTTEIAACSPAAPVWHHLMQTMILLYVQGWPQASWNMFIPLGARFCLPEGNPRSTRHKR